MRDAVSINSEQISGQAAPMILFVGPNMPARVENGFLRYHRRAHRIAICGIHQLACGCNTREFEACLCSICSALSLEISCHGAMGIEFSESRLCPQKLAADEVERVQAPLARNLL